MTKSLLVAKREYLKVIVKPSFWLSTLMFPAFIVIIGFISGLSSNSVDQKVEEFSKEVQSILIVDEANIIDPRLINPPLQPLPDRQKAISLVQDKTADAAIIYPSDVLNSKQILVHAQDKGLLSNDIYQKQASALLEQSILANLKDQQLIAAANADFGIELSVYSNGVEVPSGYERLIVPGISVVIYFVLINFAASYLLLSVSEEKENRMIETVLALIPPRELILGKILGQIAIVLTQLLVLVALGGLAIIVMKLQLPLDFSQVTITPAQLLIAIFYVLIGFIIMASIMVGVGSAMPTYKEAQSFSSIFIIASIFPVYLAAAIIADPNGSVAVFFSFFPLSAPLVLLFRNALGVLSTTEVIATSVMLILFAALSYILAFKLFEFGALEYSRKISFRSFLKTWRK